MPIVKKPAAVKTAVKTVAVKPLTSWSFSRYTDYKTCPLKAKLKHVDRMKEPPSAAMERGNTIHNLAENFVKGLLPKLPPELKGFAEDFKTLKGIYKRKTFPIIVEDQWAFTAEWDDTEWNNWAECWLRIKLDVAHYEEHVLYVTDWKTGKHSDFKATEYAEQLELYALAALLKSQREDVEVMPRLGWLDEGFYTYPQDKEGNYISYNRADIPALKKLWATRTKAMMSDTRFAPKANSTCKWCWFGQSGKAKGGPGLCKF